MSATGDVLHWLPYVVSIWLFVIGLYGVITSRHMVRLIIALAVAQSSTYVLLLSAGFRFGATAPVFTDVPLGTATVDPVVQALAFTDIVVGATVSALLLSITILLRQRGHSVDPQRLAPFQPVPGTRRRMSR